jgi:hypothetical protein
MPQRSPLCAFVRSQQGVALVCLGGQIWSLKEQKTQQSPGSGRNTAEQAGQV